MKYETIKAFHAGVERHSLSGFWQAFGNVISALTRHGPDARYSTAPLHAQLVALRAENAQLKRHCAQALADQALRGADALERARLAELAYTDCLTGLANRRAFLQAAQAEIVRMRLNGRAACVLLGDIDHFKAVNDQVLQRLAHTLRTHTRASDTVARWGGEEFIVLLPETTLAAAQGVAEKCRLAVQTTQFGSPRAPMAVSVTFGVSAVAPAAGIEAAIARADAAMYAGKKGGRNCVVLA